MTDMTFKLSYVHLGDLDLDTDERTARFSGKIYRDNGRGDFLYDRILRRAREEGEVERNAYPEWISGYEEVTLAEAMTLLGSELSLMRQAPTGRRDLAAITRLQKRIKDLAAEINDKVPA